MGAKFPRRIEPKFSLEEDIPNVITRLKFGVDRLRGLASAEGQIVPFPLLTVTVVLTTLSHYRVIVCWFPRHSMANVTQWLT